MPTPRKIPSTGLHAIVDGPFLRFWDERTRINRAVAALNIFATADHARDRNLATASP